MADDPYFDAFDSFVTEFRQESDRAAVILGAAKLDQALYLILQRRLVPLSGNNDDLLDADSPLSTFSARINVVYRLGILDAQFARALHLVRKIRNSFAHEMTSSRLDVGAHRDRVRELIAPYQASKGFAGFREAFFGEDTGVGVDFRCVLASMAGRLEAVYDGMTPFGQDEAWALVPPDAGKSAEAGTPHSLNQQLATPS